MQLICQPGGASIYNFTATASGNNTITSAVLNTNGIVVNSVAYVWSLGAVSSQLFAGLDCSASETFANVYEDNGPAGIINVSRSALFINPVQFRPGFIFRFSVGIVGTARVSVTVTYRVL